MVWYRHTISKYCVQSNSQMEGMDNDEQSHKPNGGVNQVKTNRLERPELKLWPLIIVTTTTVAKIPSAIKRGQKLR